jgi:coenzyme PQQ synthesis protein D (PqqD)
MAVGATDLIHIGESAIYQEVGDEAVILNLSTQNYYGLDDVGAAMWRSILQYGSIEGAMTELKAIYDVDEAVLRADLIAIVDSLMVANLLTASAV